MTFLTMVDTLGKSESFLVYAAFCVGAFFFTQKYVPETRGKTLEEIEISLRAAAAGSTSNSSASGGVSGTQNAVASTSGSSDTVAAAGSAGSGSSLKSGLLDSDGP